MSKHFPAMAALAGALFAAQAVARSAPPPDERDYARDFYAGFVEAREVDARCDLLEPERRAKYAEYLEYLRQDAVRDYDAAIVGETREVGKRYARDPAYLDCGQAAMDRVENRYERIEFLVGLEKWRRETPEGHEFTENLARIREKTEAEAEAEATREDVAPDPEAQELAEAGEAELYRNLLKIHLLFVRTETRCRFLDEPLRARALAVHERAVRTLRNRIADPAAAAAIESAPDPETGCGDGLSQQIHALAEGLDETETMVELFEMIDTMTTTAQRRQEAAAAADLSVPLPPPPADRPRPLTRAQKDKLQALKFYASAIRRQRIETRCRFLPEQAHERFLRSEARDAERLRRDIGDPAAIAEIDATPDPDTACGDAQRIEITRAASVIDWAEGTTETMAPTRPQPSP